MEDADEIFNAIDSENGHFYVCGDVKMAHDVTTKLEQIIMENGRMTPEEAKHYIVTMRVRNRNSLTFSDFWVS